MKIAVMLCAALGGFLFGYDTTVINAALFQMKDHFGFSEHSWKYALIVAIALAGAFVGSFASGFIATRFGRRISIIVADILFTVGSVLMAAAPNVEVILVSRVLVGFAVGISSCIIPVYLAEVTPPQHRGAVISLNNLFVTGAQFIAALVTGLLVIFTDINVGWRIGIGLGAVPSLLQMICIFAFLPESPAWLMCKGREEEAKRISVEIGIDITQASKEALEVNYRTLFSRAMRARMLLSCALAAIQQFSGINTIMYYSAVILQDAGFKDPQMPVILSIPLAFMNALFTVVALFTVDRFGRRKMILSSVAGCLVVTLGLTIIGFLLNKQIPYSVGGWLFLGFLAVFLACFAPGLGCIPWVVMGEIFPAHLRSTAASVATMTNWAANAVVSQVFPLLLGSIGVGGTFAIICGLLVVSFIFLWFCMVETKGLSLEQIDNMFRTKAGLKPVYKSLDEEDEGDLANDVDMEVNHFFQAIQGNAKKVKEEELEPTADESAPAESSTKRSTPPAATSEPPTEETKTAEKDDKTPPQPEEAPAFVEKPPESRREI
uniref:Myo-inositol/H symporter 3 n=1 Tax=Angomonas desouzai TaxID=59800 RepID=A0A0C5KM84_9TRYP|nr:myo-inositol/H symporter 3 [Angomonas desouzai]